MRKVALVVVLILMAGRAQALLIDRGSGLIYDDDLDITWMQDANYAKTSGYDADGLMTWQEAMDWAGQLAYGGYSDWRLPTAFESDGDICWGWNCSGSEMGHLFYTEFDLMAGENMGSSSRVTAIFNNVPTDLISVALGITYWTSSVDVDYYPVLMAVDFETVHGNQKYLHKSNSAFAWAVRPGDVDPVPEPSTALLMGLGLAGLAARRR